MVASQTGQMCQLVPAFVLACIKITFSHNKGKNTCNTVSYTMYIHDIRKLEDIKELLRWIEEITRFYIYWFLFWDEKRPRSVFEDKATTVSLAKHVHMSRDM